MGVFFTAAADGAGDQTGGLVGDGAASGDMAVRGAWGFNESAGGIADCAGAGLCGVLFVAGVGDLALGEDGRGGGAGDGFSIGLVVWGDAGGWSAGVRAAVHEESRPI